jgi:uncharacterized protein (TIGR03083 family)
MARQVTDLRELGAVYEDARGRIFELVSDLDDEGSRARVPACPEWSIRDVIAHTAGVCTDIINGNLTGAASDDWTGAQVEARRDWPFEDVVAEWNDRGPQIAAMLDDFPGRYGSQLVADVTTHEHDIRGALGRHGERDSVGVAIGLNFLAEAVFHPAMVSFGLGPLEVRAADRTWIVGTGDPPTHDPDSWSVAAGSSEPIPAPTKPTVGVLNAEPFELFRAITGRRSADQIRAFDWTVDPEPYLPTFGFGPFTVRPTDLDE